MTPIWDLSSKDLTGQLNLTDQRDWRICKTWYDRADKSGESRALQFSPSLQISSVCLRALVEE